jgi:hypothetical protein
VVQLEESDTYILRHLAPAGVLQLSKASSAARSYRPLRKVPRRQVMLLDTYLFRDTGHLDKDGSGCQAEYAFFTGSNAAMHSPAVNKELTAHFHPACLPAD